MTQISGKIYQMKNAAGTENRFPRTVMEAVYGLNTYLQDQFSALADIYMPIEGITESKTGQEFVYRQSAATIKAKSLTLDRIYGKTLAWNQIAEKRTSSPAGTVNGLTCTVSTEGIISISGTATETTDFAFTERNISIIAGHKYFLSPAIGTTYAGLFLNGAFDNYVGPIFSTQNNESGRWICRRIAKNATVNEHYAYPVLVDLTLLYGSAIDDLTDEQILAKFESEFPGYHDFGNKLISNDAESIETVGFNLWDEEWEAGAINPNTGGTQGSNSIRTKNYVHIIAGQQYYVPSAVYVVWCYDNNYTPISRLRYGGSGGGILTMPNNATYIRFDTIPNYGTTYNHDICINLSDPAKNGTYEPYRKTTMQLGLNNFKVKDGNGNITTITGGLKSAGSVRDEIVGNKYIKRVGEVDLGTLTWDYNNESVSHSVFKSDNLTLSKEYGAGTIANAISNRYAADYRVNVVQGTHNKVLSISGQTSVISGNRIVVSDNLYTDAAAFKTAVNGVMLYYELATPIEYELFEPIVYSMAAGTTEARISPNSDGLSAPFCCDMTYSANANNDSANAQYAATAGRLYNTHKLWGQDFDGSGNVTGAMTGVDSINGLVTLGANRMVEIGSQNSGGTARVYGLLSANSLSSAGNVDVGGNITASGINAQHSFDGTTTIKDLSVTSAAYFGKSNSPVDVYVRGQFTVGSASVNKPTTLNGTLNATGNTTIGGTFTVGTSSVNKATTLYGALTASGAVSFTSTLGVTGLSTLAGGIKLTTTKKIWFGDSYYLELTSTGLHTNAGFYSDSFITAGGVGSGSGGGSNLVKERAYDIGLTQFASSDYAELIRSPYISDSESGYMFAYSPAFLDTASQMHDYVIEGIGHEIGSCDIQWIGIAIGSTYTDAGVFDSGAFLVLANSGSTYYWYEFEV